MKNRQFRRSWIASFCRCWASSQPSTAVPPLVALFLAGLLGVVSIRLPTCLSAAPSGDEPAEKPAAEEKPTTSLDDELLKGLGGDPLGELEDLLPPKPKATTEESHRDATDELDDELLKSLERGEDMGGEGQDDGNPLVRISRRMRQVEKRILDNKSDDETQDLQKQIVSDLEKLVEEIKRRSQSSSSSSQQQMTSAREKINQPQTTTSRRAGTPSDKAARDSTQRQGSPEVRKPDMAQMQDLLKDVWGELPARLRQQIMQSSVEQFLPKYELLIEEYFKALVKRRQDRP